LPTIIQRQQLIEGNSKLQTSQSVAQVAGPGIAGVLVAVLTAPIAIFVDAVSFLVSGILVRLINPDHIQREPERVSQSALMEAREGIHTVFHQPVIRALTLTASTRVVFAFAFLSVYILFLSDNLGLGPGAIGLVLSLGGVGALIGAIIARPAAERLGIGRANIFGQVMFGLLGMVIPVAVYFPSMALQLVLVSEFTQWMMFVITHVNALSPRQSFTPNRLLGMVNATHHMLVAGLMPIGALMGGWIGELYSVQTTLVVAVFGGLAASLWFIFSPIRTIQSPGNSSE
jgi:predicted MFS family arabinose efflux permease